MEITSGISIDKKVRFGKWVSVLVDLVLGKLAGGMTYKELMTEYDLRQKDILAVLDYVAKQLA